MEEKPTFNYKEFEDEAIKRLQSGAPLEGKDEVLGPLIKRLIEAGLNGEMVAHLIQSQPQSNRRNGKTGKRVKTTFGKIDIHAPTDHNSTFEPQLNRSKINSSFH